MENPPANELMTAFRDEMRLGVLLTAGLKEA
jgi:hypothetical protein